MMLGKFRRNSSAKHTEDDGLLTGMSRAEIAQSVLLMREYETSGQGWFWATDQHGVLIYFSPRAAATLGSVPEELLGRPLSKILIEDREIEKLECEEGRARSLKIYLAGRKAFSDIVVCSRDPGIEQRWSLSGSPQRDAQGQFTGFCGHATDVTERYRSQNEVSRLAMYDSLTGLSNRFRLTSELDRQLRVCTVAKRACAIMLLDLDRFKAVNDTLGHQAGDELLKQVAQRLSNITGDKFELGRLGGDEFQIILPDIDDRGRLADVGQAIVSQLSQPYSIDGNRCLIGASVGIAIAPYDGVVSAELLRSADLALYAAKGGGRGQFRFYSSELHKRARERSAIEEALRDALVNDEIRLKYQPYVEGRSGEVVGYEALMRWHNAEMGEIPPSKFIPVAEETNLIAKLGEWALRRACLDAAQWPDHVSVAINFSAAQLHQDGLVSMVANAIAQAGISPSRLELEITESVFISDLDRTDALFRQLKKLGVRLSLDDFGTGFSSLSYLGRAPFDKVKIDRSFVVGSTDNDSRNPAIISAIVSVANALGMVTTVEGVEAHDELDLVLSKNVNYVQGYLFSKAMTHEDVIERMGEGRLVLKPEGPKRNRAERHSVFRKVGVVHGDHRYEVRLRNLSRTGAMIEGIANVPVGTELVLDLGGGQLVLAIVRRSEEDRQGIEFESTLISDGNDGLCTRFRTSPYALAAAGMPLQPLPSEASDDSAAPANVPAFNTRSYASSERMRKAG